MRREEEIARASEQFGGESHIAFIKGAQWADRTMIDKACEWLYEYNRKQTNKMFGTVHTADVTINVAEFRKAMEGGEE